MGETIVDGGFGAPLRDPGYWLDDKALQRVLLAAEDARFSDEYVGNLVRALMRRVGTRERLMTEARTETATERT